MNKIDSVVSTDKIVTIRGVGFSKLHSKHTLTIKEEEGKIILEHEDYRCLVNGLGDYMGDWRGKKITVDENYKVVKV